MSLISVIITSATIYVVMSIIDKIVEDVYKSYEWNKEIEENKKTTIDERGDVVGINYYSETEKSYKAYVMPKDKFEMLKNNFNTEDELSNKIHLFYENESK